jgi:hypothetical protein
MNVPWQSLLKCPNPAKPLSGHARRQGLWLSPCKSRARWCPHRSRRRCTMNHRAPRRAFALRRAASGAGRRRASRRAVRPRLRLAAAAGCALVSTTATLVSANEVRLIFDGVLDGALPRSDANGAPAAGAKRHGEARQVGSAHSQSPTPGTPAPVASAPPGPRRPSPATTPRSTPSPAAGSSRIEPQRIEPQRIDSTDPGGGARDGEPQSGNPQQGRPHHGNGGQIDPSHGNPGHGDPAGGDPGADHSKQGGPQPADKQSARPDASGRTSQSAPTSGPAVSASWMLAFTHILSLPPR